MQNIWTLFRCFLLLLVFLHQGQCAYPINKSYLLYTNDPFFTVHTNNASLKYRFQYSYFGPLMRNNTENYLFKYRLVYAIDTNGQPNIDGCLDYAPTYADGTSWNNTIILTIRGTRCKSMQHVQKAQAAGAAGMIIAFNDMSSFFSANLYTAKLAGDPVPLIPSVCMSNDDFNALLPIVMQNASAHIIAEFPATGPLVDPNEKKALLAIAKSLKRNDAAPNRFTTELEAYDGVFDPCVDKRISIIICFAGHISIIDATNNVYDGTIPPEISMLTELTHVRFSQCGISGIIPDLSSLTNLVTFGIYNSKSGFTISGFNFTAFTNKKLKSLVLNSNQLKFLPDISQLSNLEILVIGSNQLQTLPTFNATMLKILDLSYNRFQMPVMDFSKSQMEALDISNNQFNSNDLSTKFENMTKLFTINLSNNKITGPLPLLSNAKLLQTVMFSNNQFQGIVPSTYNIPSLQTVDLSRNQLTGPFYFDKTSLTQLDLSFNLLNPTSAWGPLIQNWFDIFQNCIPSTIVSMNFQNNLLTGTWSTPNIYKGQIVNLAYNYIQMLPNILFTQYSGITSLDVSYNNISGSLDSLDPPTSTLTKLNLVGNPKLRSATGLLPTWISFTSVNLQYSSFSCPSLQGSATGFPVFLDPSYFWYSSCKCERGYYKTPPQCTNIPMFVSNNINSSNNVAFNDAIYGSNRLTAGMDTSWTVYADPGPTTLSFFLYITPSFAEINAEFPEFSNKIELSSDCPTGFSYNPIKQQCSCKTGQVFSQTAGKCITEANDLQRINQNFLFDSAQDIADKNFQLDIYNNYASLRFTTKSLSGNKFNVNVSIAKICPSGYEYFEYYQNDKYISARCEPKYVYANSIKITVYVVSSLVTIMLAFITYVIVLKRNSLIVRSSSFPFCLCMLIFMMVLSSSSIFYAITPTDTPDVCHLRVWFTAFSLSCILSALLVKADRIRKIFASTELVVQAITNAELFKTMGMILLGQTAILIWFSASGFSQASKMLGGGEINYQLTYSCSDISSSWIGVQFAFTACFLFAGVYEAWCVRKVPSAFNEGPHIASTLLSLTVLLVILIPLQFLVSNNPNALVILRGLGQSLVCMVMGFFLFGPKLYIILEGKENDKTLSSLSSKSSSSSSSYNSSSKSTGSRA